VSSPSGVLAVIPAVQRIKMGAARAGKLARVWADEFTVHVLIGGQLQELKGRGLLSAWSRSACLRDWRGARV